MTRADDTIFALSSGRPPAAIGVVRLSGAAAFAAATMLGGSLPAPRTAGLRTLVDGEGRPLDRALVIVFPGPTTATGEDLVEFHCHGGRAVIAAVERTLAAMPGCRMAEPGEFTRRALSNGRIDLAEAEGLADLLEAETEGARVAALAAAEGVVSREVRGWLDRIMALSARIEAVLDHADEDDVDDDAGIVSAIGEEARAFGGMLATLLAEPPVERWRDGVAIVIAGPPNSGKSTLFNLLAERDAAIVSPIAGTTRDRIEAGAVRGGAVYRLLDTAGLTATDDPIEAIGVERAEAAIVGADVLVWLGDEAPPQPDALWVHARCDLPGRSELPVGRTLAVRQDDRRSIAALWRAIEQRVAALLPRADMLPLRARHRELVRAAASILDVPSRDPVILGEQLRQARVALAAIIGVDATEAMLDALFTRFCIGK
jgi:tRNA modification GTPase